MREDIRKYTMLYKINKTIFSADTLSSLSTNSFKRLWLKCSLDTTSAVVSVYFRIQREREEEKKVANLLNI